MSATPQTVDQIRGLLAGHNYIAGGRLSTAVFLALSLKRPLFLEGEAGVGKTELAALVSALPSPDEGESRTANPLLARKFLLRTDVCE